MALNSEDQNAAKSAAKKIKVEVQKSHLLPKHRWLDGLRFVLFGRIRWQLILPRPRKMAMPSQEPGCLYVKLSMDGAPYLRKVDLKNLSSALEKMFSCFTIGQCSSNGDHMQEGLSASRLMDLLLGSEYVLTYEDKDGDWMLVGDVPGEMFTDSCKRMMIMMGSEAIGLGRSAKIASGAAAITLKLLGCYAAMLLQF